MPDPNSPLAIGWLLMTLAAVLFAVERAVALWKNLRAEPPYHQQFASTTETQRIDRENASARSQIYRRLDEIDASIARLNERTQTTNETVAHIATELREVGKDVSAALAKLG